LFSLSQVLADTLVLGSYYPSFVTGSTGVDSAVFSRRLPQTVEVEANDVVQVLGFLDLEQPIGFSPATDSPIRFVVKSGGTLLLGQRADSVLFLAEFHLRAGTRLVAEAGSRVVIEMGAQLIVEPGAELVISSGADIEAFTAGAIDLMSGSSGCLDLGFADGAWVSIATTGVSPVAGICDSMPVLVSMVSVLEDNEDGPDEGDDDTPPVPPLPPPVDTVFVNQLRGVVDVNALGGLVYQIPLDIPPGTAGVQPNLGIVYSSMGGDGILGKNMSLVGLSAISRVGKNFYFDNEQSGVTLSSTDGFALDGQRLVLTGSGASRSGVDMYDTEIASFAEVVSYSHNTYGPT
jgi:hypothetical protein